MLMQASTYFSKVRRMMLCHAPLDFNTLFANFNAASRAPNSCHSVSSCERSSNFGALGLRWWGSPGHIYPSEGFWSRILVWRAIAFVNFTRWIGLGMSVLFRRIDFGDVMSCNTKPNCRASENWRLYECCPYFLSLLLPRFLQSIVTSIWDEFSFLPNFLFQHRHSTFVIILFRPFCRLFINLTMCEWALFTEPTTALGLVEYAFWRVPLFTKWVIASSSKVILARPSRHLPLGLLPLGLRVLDDFRSFCCMKEFGDGFDGVTFPMLIHIVAETAIVSFHTLPVGFPLPTISKNSLSTLFHSMILDHRRSSQNFHFWRQNSHFEFPARY